MMTKKEIKTMAGVLYAQACGNLDVIRDAAKAQLSSANSDDVLKTLDFIIRGCVSAVTSLYDGEVLPTPIVKAKRVVGSNVATITVKTKLNVRTKYKIEFNIDLNSTDAIDTLYSKILDAVTEMYYLEKANDNIDALNAKIASICAENSIPYVIEFAIDYDSSSSVLSIDNTKVVFNASTAEAHDIPSMYLMYSGDEYNMTIAKEAEKVLVESLKTLATPVQVVKGNIDIVMKLSNVKSKKRAVRFIREAYHKNARYFDNMKRGISYYNEKVKIGDEVVELFALIRKNGDNDFEVVLDPFNVVDNTKVDFDVIAELGNNFASTVTE